MSAVAEALTYADLLRRYEPSVPATEEEYSRAIAVLSGFMARGENTLTPNEQKFIETLAALLADYERRYFQTAKAPPADVLRELMRGRGMKPKDLWGLFGSKGVTSEVLRGKRGISKERAKALAEMFCVPVDLFL
jgi:HTH-type transcriptional regulator/antitoxin HigA